ncbi:16S rRNA (cytosine(967)-C(5))-methyltransferase RsmB [Oceanivirga salmonicida]|uniref:16S rRNA (cytosine(967)-C(5))-methyltransferase RsmB n=1 Tax=Oceanivirga salmonicida TaxID=1769291 RepID=UPI0012E2FB0A|nr:16S rRNA (cytosine(967)-C(5))-methyltransferase RsmB [Oceanivirga salmonicida]
MIKEDLVHILDNIIDKQKFSNMEMNYYFKIKKYSLEERAFVKNLLNVTIKNLIYIDYLIDNSAKKVTKRKTRQILRMTLAQMYFTNSDIKGAVYEAVQIAKEINVEQGKFVNAVLKDIIKNKEKVDRKIEAEKLYYVKYSYPRWLYEKICIDWGNDALEIMKSLKERSYLSLRINTKKITNKEFEEKIKKVDTKVLFQVENVYYLSNYKVFERKIFKEDEVFIQDASSYIVAKNMNIKKGAKVLDACSAPGGKSIAMLNMYEPEVVFSCDIYEHKLDALNEIKEKLNLKNMTVLNRDASKEESFMENIFDNILLDIPCSGLGVLRRKPEKVYTLDSKNIKSLKKLQKKIFETNLTYLKKGGELIYSSCTITKNENTNNVKYFLEKHKNLEVSEVYIPDNIEYVKDEFGGVYISPKNKYVDGFYIIKFKKG